MSVDLAMVQFSHAQRRLFAAWQPMDVCLLQGGWGSGKTFISVVQALKLAMAQPNTTGLIIAPHVKTLRDDIAPRMMAMLAPFKFWYNQQTRVFRFPNGSRIYLRTLKNSQAIAADYIWIELSDLKLEQIDNNATEAQFKQLLTQLKPGPQPKRMWLTCRPVPYSTGEEAAPVHWINQYFGPQADHHVVQPFRRVCLNTHDNPTLTDNRQLAHLTLTHTTEEMAALTASHHPTEPSLIDCALPRVPSVLVHRLKPVVHISNGAQLNLFPTDLLRLGKFYAASQANLHHAKKTLNKAYC